MVRARREIEPGKVIETEERGCTLASKVKVVERPFKEVTSELRLECENGARHEKIDQLSQNVGLLKSLIKLMRT